MNKTESKYYRTACAIDEAFLALLEDKDFDYLTVKEICQKAGVNRSTFYLHYDTTRDLLNESIEYLSHQLLAKYQTPRLTEQDFAVGDLDKLLLYTPQYTVPYLEFIKTNKRAFMTAVAKQELFDTERTFDQIFTRVLSPILSRYQVPTSEQRYLVRFYMSGIHAIIIEWLKGGCTDAIDTMAALIVKIIEQSRTECPKTK